MKISESLQRMEGIYHALHEDCFVYVGTLLHDEITLQPNHLKELRVLVEHLKSTDLYNTLLLNAILNLVDYDQPIYQLSVLRPITLDGYEEKIDVLYHEKVSIEKELQKIYQNQRKRLLRESREPLAKLSRLLEQLLYAKEPVG
ncbi:hypothetical protein [Priestia koreensis]|uniref:Uncharacterized protein n=1 Tax=Priestia koreensis TaxID=284581 RepID=A0A0M0LI62_9BACI|nr:hypothetical protein [Priestia koreensis]KOO50393.1 hypothetical protein AMD01_01145 [Priestia koreensis]